MNAACPQAPSIDVAARPPGYPCGVSNAAYISTVVSICLGRIETQSDSIIGAVSDLGERVTRLEARTAG